MLGILVFKQCANQSVLILVSEDVCIFFHWRRSSNRAISVRSNLLECTLFVFLFRICHLLKNSIALDTFVLRINNCICFLEILWKIECKNLQIILFNLTLQINLLISVYFYGFVGSTWIIVFKLKYYTTQKIVI